MDPMTPFRPVIEPNLPGAFLIEDPYTVHETGKVSDISLMAGLSSEEGGTRTSSKYKEPPKAHDTVIYLVVLDIMGKSDAMKTLNEDRYRIFPLTFSYYHSVEEPDRVTDAIYSHYFQNRTIDMSQKDALINVSNILKVSISYTDWSLNFSVTPTVKNLVEWTFQFASTFNI